MQKILPLLGPKFLALIISDQLKCSLKTAKKLRLEEINRKEREKKEKERLD
jgi:hypothetical protein